MNELSITYNKKDMELLRFTPLNIDDEARQKRAKAMAAHYSHPIEIPNLYKPMRVAVYIRYFNSADIEDWLDAIKKFYIDGLANIPAWTFVDFYIDEGPSPNNMENNKEWCRLLDDCFAGKVDLIMTQKTTSIQKQAVDKVESTAWDIQNKGSVYDEENQLKVSDPQVLREFINQELSNGNKEAVSNE